MGRTVRLMVALTLLGGGPAAMPEAAHAVDGGVGLTSRQPQLGIVIRRPGGDRPRPLSDYYPARWYNSPFQFSRTPPDGRDRPKIYCPAGEERCAAQ